jgi:hypothetical protein
MARIVFKLALAILLIPPPLSTVIARDIEGQPTQTEIGNFRVVNVSSAQIRVIVDYVFLGSEATGPVSIHATPEEAGSVFDPRLVEVEEIPVQTGRQTVSLLITKRNDARDFTSMAIRVCMSTVDRAVLCRDFPHEKRWTAPVPPPDPLPPPPPTPPPPKPCAISGTVSGRLAGVVLPDNPLGKPVNVRLRHMVLMGPNDLRRTSPVTISSLVDNTTGKGRFTFSGLTPDVDYRISAAFFKSDPTHRVISCKAGSTRIVSFRILGPIPEG